jgi:hypothetical protein
MHDARLRHLRALCRRKWTRGLRRLAWFLDAQPDRRRHESSGRRRRWLGCDVCRGGDRCRRFFDWLFDNRWFFDGRCFGNDHDRRCFINDNRRRWFDFDNGRWRNDGNRNLDGLRLDDRRWCRDRSNGFCRLSRGSVRLDGLDQARWTEDWRRRLGRFGLLQRRCLFRGGRLGGWNGVLGEHVAARKRDAALSREPLDERARDHFLDGARGALQLDSVIALEQRQHFLACCAE